MNSESGWQLHKHVYAARNAKRFEEALCLAQGEVDSSDKVLAGAAQYEMSYAWEGLTCHASAVAAIQESLRVRPNDKNGWKETCDRCVELKASCDVCKTPAPSLAPCPSKTSLLSVVGSAMLSHTPKGTIWKQPRILFCTPIGLPKPGWQVVASVAQEIPDRDIHFYLALDATTSKVVAMSERDQRSIREGCSLSLNKVEPHIDTASTVFLDEACSFKAEREYSNKLVVRIKPPAIEVTGRDIIR